MLLFAGLQSGQRRYAQPDKHRRQAVEAIARRIGLCGVARRFQG